MLEAEAWRRAHDGIEEPILYKGQVVTHVRKYSDLLLMFLLKGLRPEKFRDKFSMPQHELEKMIERELRILKGEEQANENTEGDKSSSDLVSDLAS